MILNLCPNPSIDAYAWLESFETGGVNRITKIKEYPGGKGIHVAAALAELTGSAKLLGAWAGGTGAWIKEECRKKAVEAIGVDLAGNNRKCFTFRSGNTAFNNSELLEPGPSLTKEKWSLFKNLFQQQLSEASLFCMSGSWPQQAPKDAYAQLIAAAKKENTPTLLDCSGNQLQEALKTGFFGLHLNQFEAEKLCGSQDIHKLLQKINNKVELIALTKGKDGLILSYKGELISANVEIDKIISTVGSGDCLTAGIAYGVSKGLTTEEIAAYGVACGAANCLTEDLGFLESKLVKKLLPNVKTKKLTRHE